MRIRRAQPGDVEPALAVMSEAFGLAITAPSVHTVVADPLLVAEEDGRIIGTAAAAGFGRTAWLGGIAVAPEARGQGLGRQLTEAALEALGPRETILLLASALGRPIYDRLSFVAESTYRVFMSHASGDGAVGAPGDATAIDRHATGEDRPLPPAFVHGRAAAFQPQWRALPIVGEPGDAEQLLRSRIEPGLRLAVPEENTRATTVLEQLGTEREGVVRMRLGPPVDWRPQQIWGVFSLFYG